MKIALLTSEFPPFRGGVSSYARDLCAAAIDAGHDVTVLAPDYGANQQGLDRHLPGSIRRFPGGPASMRGLGRRIVETRRLLGGERFDIVHAADWPFFIPLRLANRHGARTLLTVHGSEILYMQAARRRIALNRLGILRPGWASWIANSGYTRDLLLHAFPRIGSARAVPLAVSDAWRAERIPRQDARRTYGLTGDDIVIVSLGRVVPRKGHAVLAEALERLPAKMAAKLQWWVIGPLIEPDHAAYLRSRTEGLPVRTTFFGALPGEDVQRRLSAADIFCLPGHREAGRVEGFGLVFLEAGAYGVPSVATRSGGVPEAVEDGVSGLLVPERDPVALAAALERLIVDGALRSRLAQSAEARAAATDWADVMRATYVQ